MTSSNIPFDYEKNSKKEKLAIFPDWSIVCLNEQNKATTTLMIVKFVVLTPRWRLAQYDFLKDPIYFRITPLSFYITYIILPLIEILKFDWLRQILYAAILCWRLAQYDFFQGSHIFRITPLSVYITNNIVLLCKIVDSDWLKDIW